MKPTHIVRTLGPFYLCDLSLESDYQIIQNCIGTVTGNLRLAYMVEDDSQYDKKQYTEKVAVIACRHIIGVEEM